MTEEKVLERYRELRGAMRIALSARPTPTNDKRMEGIESKWCEVLRDGIEQEQENE